MTELKDSHVISARKDAYEVPLSKQPSYKGQSPPVKLTFDNLEFEVNIVLSKEEATAKGQKVVRQKIVKGATGYALPGETLYIMGSSGAGKTSLLNILSDRISNKNGQEVTGRIMVNDTLPLTQDQFGKFAAYVMQDDILYDSFTPREALTFAARLKLQGTEEQQNERVEELLEELGLINVAETIIGSVMRKTISGGERKRTAIGVELVTDPSLILLDEPTSGLDSFKALQIVRLLERQAKKGKTVIATIHQPSSDAFSTFDRLILMMDGYTVYQGRAKDSTSYFATIGFQCPTRSNPADYFMKVLTVNYPKAESDEAHISNLFEHYNKSLAPQIEQSSKALALPPVNVNESSGAGVCKQFKQLMWRNRQGLKRNPGHGRIKIGQTIFMGLLCLALFHDQYGQDTPTIRSLIGGLFFIAINQTMMTLMGTILTFQNERPVFLREQANKMYSVTAYYVAKILIETPVLAFTPMLFSVIVYFKIGLTITASQFFYFYLVVFLICQCAASFGYFVSSIFEKEEMAVALAPIVMMPLMLFGGQFANSGNIQAWISWFQYISPIRYGFEALCKNEFDSRNYNTTAIFKSLTNNSTVTVLNAFANPQYNKDLMNKTLTQIQSPELNPSAYQGMNVGMWQCLVILAGLTVGIRILSFIFLKMLVSKFQ